jgi:DNA mismatch repair ATPase MutS
MDSINNLITASLFNGVFIQPACTERFIKMEKEHAVTLEDWLIVIGEFEMLISLANLSYNNPEFVFPIIQHSKLVLIILVILY